MISVPGVGMSKELSGQFVTLLKFVDVMQPSLLMTLRNRGNAGSDRSSTRSAGAGAGAGGTGQQFSKNVLHKYMYVQGV